MTGCCPIRRFALNTSEWTPIITPVDCSYYVILQASDAGQMLRCSNVNDAATTHDTYGYAFIVPSNSSEPRWVAGDIVTWLKAKSGTPDAIVEFISG